MYVKGRRFTVLVRGSVCGKTKKRDDYRVRKLSTCLRTHNLKRTPQLYETVQGPVISPVVGYSGRAEDLPVAFG